MNTFIYTILILLEVSYLMFLPVERLVNAEHNLTESFFNLIGGNTVELITIIMTVAYFLQLAFIFYRGR